MVLANIAPMRLHPALLALAAALLVVPLAADAQVTEDVPFITTPDHVTLAMLKLARVSAKDHVLDLGSGDGRIVITAAKRFGASGHGVEIVPDLVARSQRNAELAGVAGRATFAQADLFETDLSPASVITMYLLPEVNLKLRPRLLALKPGTRIVSHDWDLGDWRPDRTLTLPVPDKAVGREKLSRLHLWTVPAAVAGLWCGRGATLQLSQRYQFVEGTLQQGPNARALHGRIDGTHLGLDAVQHPPLRAEWKASPSGERLVLASALVGSRGLAREFTRAEGKACPA